MLPIIAISTSFVNSAIGIIRISFGDKVFLDLNIFFFKIFKKKLLPRYATFVNFYYNNNILDNGIAIFFPRPFSYTGEDILEFHGHGNYYNLNYILKVFLLIFKKINIRIAKKGEFTKRAFLNKKINYFHVQNLLNLLNINNNFSLKFIHNNFTNDLYIKLNKLFDVLISIKNYIKYNIYNNYSFNKLKIFYKLKYILKKIFNIYKNINNNINNELSIILIGSSNTGKSTIINKLIKEKSLIVSSVPGTTRDLVNRILIINNFRVNIYDTAGLRFSKNNLETKGMNIAFKQLKKSDIILYVFDEKIKINFFFKKILKYISMYNIFILIFNKIDLFGDFVSLEIFIVFFIKNINIKISGKYNLGINILYIELGRVVLKFNKLVSNNFFYTKNIVKIYKILKQFLNKFKIKFDFLSPVIDSLVKIFTKILFLKKKNTLFKNFCIGK